MAQVASSLRAPNVPSTSRAARCLVSWELKFLASNKCFSFLPKIHFAACLFGGGEETITSPNQNLLFSFQPSSHHNSPMRCILAPITNSVVAVCPRDAKALTVFCQFIYSAEISVEGTKIYRAARLLQRPTEFPGVK